MRELHGGNLAILGAGADRRQPGAHGGGPRHAGARDAARSERRWRTPERGGARPPDLHALLGWADFVVLAVPLTDETRGLIGAAELRAMRSSAFLINIARGEVVDEAALVRCLRAGGIAGAALDVFTEEPLPAGHPLRGRCPTLVLTPHISGYTATYFDRMLALFEDNLARFLGGPGRCATSSTSGSATRATRTDRR